VRTEGLLHEYAGRDWGAGRVAALVHTNPEGTADIALPENVRFYFIAGTQHSPSRFPPAVTNGQQEDNAVDYWWTMRALLMAMHKWVKEDVAPPPSLYPRLEDGTLVPAASVAFPAIPGVQSPRPFGRHGSSTRCMPIREPAEAGAPMPLLVPRWTRTATMPAFVCPKSGAARHLHGWNFRSLRSARPASSSRSSVRRSLSGDALPARRRRIWRSVEERPRRETSTARVEQALDALVLKRYLIYDDGPRICSGRAISGI
jgi:hypothetical protein